MLRLALIGDSIAWGMGATAPESRLAARLTRRLREVGVDAVARVFAVPGARSSGLAPQVDQALGWSPDAAVIVIGANDLTHLEPVDAAIASLAEAVSRLRRAGSEVVLAPAPDLSMVPHVPPALRPLVQAASAEFRTGQIAAAEALGARVADPDASTAAVFRADRSLFSPDRFHPSDAGYEVIAAAIAPHLLAAAVDDHSRIEST